MKKVLFIILILTQITSVFSQTKKQDFGFELRYPIPIGNNSLPKSYYGIIDIGMDYSFIHIKNCGIGILLNSSFLIHPQGGASMVILSPKIKIDYEISMDKISIIPMVAFGYSNWRTQSNFMGYSSHSSMHGLTLKGATKVVFKSDKKMNWYLLFAYEFTQLEKPGYNVYGSMDTNYNRIRQILYPGVGMIWKFNTSK